jgi:hypothetical protein
MMNKSYKNEENSIPYNGTESTEGWWRLCDVRCKMLAHLKFCLPAINTTHKVKEKRED